MHPDFRSKTVLVTDTWDYVRMWLQRNKKDKALFYWEQAAQFHQATLQLPNTSAPLTAYYSFLNAAKTLLTVRSVSYSDYHGVSGESKSERAHLSHELIKFHGGGLLAGLCKYIGESANNETYTLQDILYNLPFVHRAFILTFSSWPELFTPISNPRFVRKSRSAEAWCCTNVNDDRYATQHTINKLPAGFEQDGSPELTEKGQFVIRKKSRFNWKRGNGEEAGNLQRLTDYHRKIRKHLMYIHGPSRLWYIKRGDGPNGYIDRCSLTLTFAAMHRLSELARYNPTLLSKHLASQHNWLLSEFITTARYQFIDEISSEITGQDFLIPGRRTFA